MIGHHPVVLEAKEPWLARPHQRGQLDRKSTRLNSSHANISYAVFCLKKKNNHELRLAQPESLAMMTPGRQSRKRAANIVLILTAAIMHFQPTAAIARFATLELTRDPT